MTNVRSFILKALLPLGAMLALTACIDPVIIGGNGDGGNGGTGGSAGGGVACMADSNCAPGQSCVNGVCSGGGGMTCGGMPSPLSCTQTGCAAGQTCVMDPDPNACYPSSCGCDAATGLWVCTADCGPGGICVPSQQCGANGMCPPGTMCDASGMCVGGCTPSPETCNAIDDDCDGAIDEQEDPALPLCADGSICVMGQCGGGNVVCMADADCPPNQVCLNGVCSGGATCTPEICNGIDDDCNGAIDDATPGATLCPMGGQCIMGQCGGVVQCGPNSPCPAGQVCNPNGVCSPGGCLPKPETCNAIDDDCDGVVDDATPGTTLCPNGGLCVMGQCGGVVQCGPNSPCPVGQVCSATGVCMPGACQPVPETCNGKDDDCDGIVDDASAGATLCPNGFCLAGACTMQCNSNANCPAGQLCVNGLCK